MLDDLDDRDDLDDWMTVLLMIDPGILLYGHDTFTVYMIANKILCILCFN